MADNPMPRPPRVTGLPHLFAACRHSAGGMRRLWPETAFRIQLVLGAGALACLLWLGVGGRDLAIFAGLFLILVAVEALNTAIEVIVDHLAPDWQAFARDAKDLGSLAVACVYGAHAVFLGWVLATHL